MNDENGLSPPVKETVTKPVWSKVKRLRELLRTKDITEWRYGRPYPYRWTKSLFSKCRKRNPDPSIWGAL